MTDEQINIKIMGILGWKTHQRPKCDDLGPIGNLTEDCWYHPELEPLKPGTYSEQCLPSKPFNYAGDANLMLEACESLLGYNNGWAKFIDKLCVVTGAVNCSMIDALIITNRATAHQWAEALLRVFDMWEED